MKGIFLASAACAAFLTAAAAQEMPKLSDFLANCYRDTNYCRVKLKDYLTAAQSQNIVCLPEDTSVGEAANDTLRWLRSSDSHDQSLKDAPLDDAFYRATQTLYPCKPPPPPPPAPAGPQDQAASPQP